MDGLHEKFWVEIDLGALRANVRRVQQHVGTQRRILLVIKSDGYGHGAVEIARAAIAEGVDTFGVATLGEALTLRQAGISEDIILLQPSLDFELEEVIAAKLQPAISNLQTAEHLSKLALGRPVKVHVEVNTGMNRMGFNPTEAPAAIERLTTLPDIHLAGIFTHFRPVDPMAKTDIKRQLDSFNSIIKQLKTQGIEAPLLHAASSLSLLCCPESYFNCVRPGLLIYGGFNGNQPASGPQTEPVMACRCRVLWTRRVQEGEWIHYGEAYAAPQEMTVAIIAAGYGAGYPKSLSNIGEVLIQGQRAPICGVVGMDMTIVDISSLVSVSPGGVVTLLGRDKKDEITVNELASKAQTIPYEIICRLGRNLPRVYQYPAISRPGSEDHVTVALTNPAR